MLLITAFPQQNIAIINNKQYIIGVIAIIVFKGKLDSNIKVAGRKKDIGYIFNVSETPVFNIVFRYPIVDKLSPRSVV